MAVSFERGSQHYMAALLVPAVVGLAIITAGIGRLPAGGGLGWCAQLILQADRPVTRSGSAYADPAAQKRAVADAPAPAPAYRSVGPASFWHRAGAAEATFRRFGIDDGCFMLLALGGGSARTFGGQCGEAFRPASTFKIANTLVGLETGVIEDERFALPWDGVERDFVAAWNRDHDLESAMANSVLWYFEEIARRVGADRYRDWLVRLDYGNRDPGGGAPFWLDGDLRITPHQQVAFLARLLRGELPVAARSRAILRRVMPSSEGTMEGETIIVRAKTGLAEQDPYKVGWLVGWIEREAISGDPEPTHVFASLVLGPIEDSWRESPTFRARAGLPMALLADLGLVPEGMPNPR